jgi:uncharacterized RDD family membrane protein YckC
VSVALPSGAREFQGDRAGIVSRGLAAGIDLGVVVVLVVGFVAARSVWTYFFADDTPLRMRWPSRLGLSSIGGLLLALYLALGWARNGRTAGKRLLGLALVRAHGGAKVSASIAILRAVLYVVFPLGFFWCAVSRSQRSVQDLVLGTAVVYDWRGSRDRAASPA